MDFRFTQFEIFTASGAFLLCLFFLCIGTQASAIENELTTQTNAAVRKADLFWVSAQASGQKMVLTGAAQDYSAKQRAADMASNIYGVSEVDNQITVIGEAGTCQQEFDERLKQERVTFKTGRADISNQSLPLLKMLASIAVGCNAAIEIAGHTDARGDASINMKLSQRRAEAVAKYLVSSGVGSAQVRAIGYGESQPVADNATESGRMANRRIEFRVLGGGA